MKKIKTLLQGLAQSSWQLMNKGALPDDSDQQRLKKVILSLIASSIAFLAIFWGSLYVISGYPLSGAIPLSYSVISFISIWHFFRSKKFAFFRFSQLLLILLLPFFLMWSLGGFANGSAVIIWSFFSPLAALFFEDLKAAARWLSAFLLLLMISALIDGTVSAMAKPMPAWLNTQYFLMNMGCGFILIYIVIHFFVRDRQEAYQRLRRNEEKIRELMMTDSLTGVGNRRQLDEKLASEIERSRRYQKPLAIIMADLDHFKSVNDNYGHTIGDEVLKDFVQVMDRTIRSSDVITRFGGEEFILLLPETDAENAVHLAERIRLSLQQHSLHGLQPAITASFGVTMLRDNDSATDLLSRVDNAMYQSKDQGRNRVTFI